MSRMGVFVVSLIPAVAGGLLGYVCVMAFLNHGDKDMFKVAGGMGAFIGLLGVLTPILGFVLTAPPPAPVAPKKKDEPGEAEADVVEEGAEADAFESDGEDDGSEIDFDEGTAETESADDSQGSGVEVAESGEFSLSDEELSAGTGSDLGLGADSMEVDAIDFSEDDDEPPAKKKKKK